MRHHPIYMGFWYLANVLLAVSILLLICAMVWEYSTRKYLEGFSDAVIPSRLFARTKGRGHPIVDGTRTYSSERLPCFPGISAAGSRHNPEL